MVIRAYETVEFRDNLTCDKTFSLQCGLVSHNVLSCSYFSSFSFMLPFYSNMLGIRSDSIAALRFLQRIVAYRETHNKVSSRRTLRLRSRTVGTKVLFGI